MTTATGDAVVSVPVSGRPHDDVCSIQNRYYGAVAHG